MSPAASVHRSHVLPAPTREDCEAMAVTLDSLAEMVVRFRVDDRTILYCNLAWAAARHATPAEMVGRRLDDLLAPEELDGLATQLGRLDLANPLLADDELRPSPNMAGRWVAWVDRYLPGSDGAQLLAVGRDVTDRYLAECRLAESEARFRDLADRSRDVVWRLRFSPKLHIDYLSPSIETLTGYPPAELQDDIGRFRDIFDEETLGHFTAAIAGEPIPSHFDARFRRRDGRVIVAELQVTPLIGGLQGTGRDVTEIRALQAQLAAQALHDPLTGLANRNLLDEVIDLALHRTSRSGAPLVLIYLDLDDFKAVNDTYGHEAGDTVLRETARRLLASMRDADVVARVGGDEFVIVHESPDQATDLIVRRLEAALGVAIDIGDGVLVSCVPSIGSVESPSAGLDRIELMAAADAAMYRVKRSRRVERSSTRPSQATSSVDRLLDPSPL